MPDLLRKLQRAHLVAGFNRLRFDCEVLLGDSPIAIDLSQIPNLDMIVDLKERQGHRLGLDSIAAATFGLNKTSERPQVLDWFQQGELAEIGEYCRFDVKITTLVHEFGVQDRQIFYKNRFGARLSGPVDWKVCLRGATSAF